MTEFIVWLGVTIEDAVSDKDAAKKAQDMIQRPGSKWLYRVTDCETGKLSVVDFFGE